MMECTRYGGRYGQMKCSIEIYNNLCKCEKCKEYADKAYKATDEANLLNNIALLKKCANKRKPDIRYSNIPTNTKDNAGKGGIPENKYYRLFPKPNGGKEGPNGKRVDEPIYDKEKGVITEVDYHRGTPSPTSLEYGPSRAGDVKDKTQRTSIRIHPEGRSLGCISVTHKCGGKELTSSVEGEGLIEQLMNEHKSCGGMYVHIVEK